MRSFRLLSCCTALLAVTATACFDWNSYDPRLVTGSAGAGGEGLQGGGGSGGGSEGGSGGGSEGGSGGGVPDCQGDEFECLPDGTAQQCDTGSWLSLGSCPLGCDATTKACRVPSNVDADQVGAGSGIVEVDAGGSGLSFNTDTGEIMSGAQVFRPAGEGLDATTGIAFSTHEQGMTEPGLGVFSMGALDVKVGAVLDGHGSNALVLVVDGDVQIDGLVTVAASDDVGGPGGYPGGAVDNQGDGPCAGLVGGGSYPGNPGNNCTSGGGGAGYAALGGSGATCTCAMPDDHAPGAGGPATCGTSELVPLIGGHGGAGSASTPSSNSQPGLGGGGGGALQITAAGTITVGATGGINAGGGGGRESEEAGGSGGGSGGAVLLEAPVVVTAAGAVLAANGGGGGAGDCN